MKNIILIHIFELNIYKKKSLVQILFLILNSETFDWLLIRFLFSFFVG